MISLTTTFLSMLALPEHRPQSMTAMAMFSLSLTTIPWLATENMMNTWFFVDSLNSPLILLTIWISALMLLASDKVQEKHTQVFTKTVTLLAATLLAVFLSRSLLSFYIAFEAALFPTLFLILTWGYQPERMQAGMYLVLYTVTASLPLLVGSLLISGQMGVVSFASPLWPLPTATLHPLFWWAMMMGAFLAKMPMYSLHLWLPKAHVEAPVAGSMVLAGILLKLGGYGMLRISTHTEHLNSEALPLVSALALVGGTVCAMICMRQTDLKALIAYSSVTHMAMVIAASLSNTQWAWNGALIMMIAHGLVSSALFVLSNSCYAVVKTRSLFLTKGLISFSPLISFMWFLSLAANMGAPPSINLQSEIMMTMGIMSTSSTLSLLIATSLFLSAAYCLHVFVATQHGGLSPSVTSFLPISSRVMACVLLHILPAFSLILKTEPFTSWC